MGQTVRWIDIAKHPKNGNPFWLGTSGGGVLLEAWHWCTNRGDFAGVMSDTTLADLRSRAPHEAFYYAEMVAPPRHQ